MHTYTLCELQTCDVSGEPAASLFCCKTLSDVFSRDQNLQVYHILWINEPNYSLFISITSIMFIPLWEKQRLTKGRKQNGKRHSQTFPTSTETVCRNHINHKRTLSYWLTAWEVSSGSRILMASGLFSEQYLRKGEAQKQLWAEGATGRQGRSKLPIVPGGFGQGFQTSDTQLCRDGVVQLGRVWVRWLKSISQHLFPSFHQLAD